MKIVLLGTIGAMVALLWTASCNYSHSQPRYPNYYEGNPDIQPGERWVAPDKFRAPRKDPTNGCIYSGYERRCSTYPRSYVVTPRRRNCWFSWC